jgi:hypothetical protein
MKKLLPLLSLILGLGGGVGAAIVLAPPDTTPASDESGKTETPSEDTAKSSDPVAAEDMEIVKLPNQFVVPVMVNKRVIAMVILTVALQVEDGTGDDIRTLEPKIRDTFLEELFGLAALGVFEDEIVSRQSMSLVRTALTERTKTLLDQKGAKVFITDMARQDVI